MFKGLMAIYESLISLGFSPEEVESMMRTAMARTVRCTEAEETPRCS